MTPGTRLHVMDKGEAIYHKINKGGFLGSDTHEIRVGEGTINVKLDKKDRASWCVVEAGLSDKVRTALCSPWMPALLLLAHPWHACGTADEDCLLEFAE